VTQQRGHHREGVEIGDAFDSFAVTQPDPVDVGPIQGIAADGCAQPELDEDYSLQQQHNYIIIIIIVVVSQISPQMAGL
jgi:hypothetical protein